jgi:TPR repeat protein
MYRLGESLTRWTDPSEVVVSHERNGKKLHNYTSALQWLVRAAEGGVPEAMMSLAEFLGKGVGVSKDATVAAGWIRRAAEAGYRPAFFPHGFAVEQGCRKIRGDPAGAEQWMRKAAQFGESRAMYNLALRSKAAGKLEEAAGWFKRASAQQWLPAVPRVAAAQQTTSPSQLLLAMLTETSTTREAGIALQRKASAAIASASKSGYRLTDDVLRIAAATTLLQTVHDPEAVRASGLCRKTTPSSGQGAPSDAYSGHQRWRMNVSSSTLQRL